VSFVVAKILKLIGDERHVSLLILIDILVPSQSTRADRPTLVQALEHCIARPLINIHIFCLPQYQTGTININWCQYWPI